MEFLTEEFLPLGLVIKEKGGGLENRGSASRVTGNPEKTPNSGVAAPHRDSVPVPRGAAEYSSGPTSPAGPERAAAAGLFTWGRETICGKTICITLEKAKMDNFLLNGCLHAILPKEIVFRYKDERYSFI